MSFGSWFRDRPRLLEYAYRGAYWLFERVDPLLKRLGYARVESWIHPLEKLGKKVIFDCRMCGQCILHSTGMTCPMTCPKNLRNGPCGGVRQNGRCEVKPEMRCVWVEAFERSHKMPYYGQEIKNLQPLVNRQLEDRSAWMTILTGEDQNVPSGWEDVSELTILDS
ncbi:MAG TPA: methylenetetrahydrofolate reductase C-terminal domain-containing protein [Anaerolineales bacterium]|nr:methylenetetrahydrofolate reductase C-terminal domain-containing protein [Anaerolineales bacterium]